VTITDGPAKDFPRTRTKVVECSTEPEEQEQYGPACGFWAVAVNRRATALVHGSSFVWEVAAPLVVMLPSRGPGQEFWIQLSSR